MSKFTDRLIEVQESVAAARAQKVTQVAQAKAAILNRQPNLNNGYTVANLDDAKQGSGPLSQTMQFQSNGPTSVNPNVFEQSSSQAISPDVFENARVERSPEIYAPDMRNDMERSVSSPLSPTAPVVGYTREGAEIRADGTHTVIDADGQQHTGLSEDDADRFQAFSRGKEEAKQSGAYESSLPTRLGGALQGGVDFILKESVNVTGPITLTDKLMQHNEATKSHLATIGAGHVAISEEDRLKYEALQKSGKEDPEFMSSYAGKQLAVLDTESKENKELYNKFEGWAKQLKDTIPIDRKDQYAARAAYLTIAKNEGNLSAMINTAKAGDIGTFIGQGVDSVAFTLALSWGNPLSVLKGKVLLPSPEGLGILYGYAGGLAKTAKAEWQAEHGKDPNQEEIKRINMYSVVEAFLEKFEALMVMRLFPGKNKAWTQGVLKNIKDKTPAAVLTLPVFAGRLSAAGGSEYISGVGTTSASIMSKRGEITTGDAPEIGYGGFAELFGMPGSVAGVAAIKGSKAIFDKAISPSKKLLNSLKQLRGENDVKNINSKLASGAPIRLDETDEDNGRHAEVIGEIKELEKDIETTLKNNRDPFDLIEEKEKLEESLRSPISEEEVKIHKEDLQKKKKEIEDWVVENEKPASQKNLEKINKRLVEVDAALEEFKDVEGEGGPEELKLTKEKEQLTIALGTTVEKSIDRLTKVGKSVAEIAKAIGKPILSYLYSSGKWAGGYVNKDLQEGFQKFMGIGEYGPVKPVEKDTRTIIEDDEFTTFVKSVSIDTLTNEGKIAKAIDSLIKLSKERKLTKEQNAILSELSAKIGEKDPKDRQEPFGSLKKVNELSRKELAAQLKDEELTPIDRSVITAALEKIKQEKIITKTGSKKGIKEVHNNVVNGPSSNWKGFNSYYKEIVRILDNVIDPALRNPQIKVLQDAMEAHYTNMEKKLKAFTIAYEKTPIPGMVHAVYGNKINGFMQYTQKTITAAQYLKERNDSKIYVNGISKNNSADLMKIVKAEVKYGKALLDIVKGYQGTSFALSAAKRKTITRNLDIKKRKLREIKFTKIISEATKEQIKNLKNPEGTNPEGAYSNQEAFPTETLKASLASLKKTPTNIATTRQIKNIEGELKSRERVRRDQLKDKQWYTGLSLEKLKENLKRLKAIKKPSVKVIANIKGIKAEIAKLETTPTEVEETQEEVNETKVEEKTPTSPTTDVTVEYQGRNYTVKGTGKNAQIVNDKGKEVYKTGGNRLRILGEAAVLRGTAVATMLKKARVIVTVDKDGNLRVMNGSKTSKSYGNVMKWGPDHGNIKTLESNADVKALRKGTNKISTKIVTKVPVVKKQPPVSKTTPTTDKKFEFTKEEKNNLLNNPETHLNEKSLEQFINDPEDAAKELEAAREHLARQNKGMLSDEGFAALEDKSYALIDKYDAEIDSLNKKDADALSAEIAAVQLEIEQQQELQEAASESALDEVEAGDSNAAYELSSHIIAALERLEKFTANQLEEIENVQTEDTLSTGPDSVLEKTPPPSVVPTETDEQDGTVPGEQDNERDIPKEAHSKQAFYVLYPEIVTQKGTLAEQDTLNKHRGLLVKLATALGLDSAYKFEINKALKALPDTKNFIEGAASTFTPTMSKEELTRNKEYRIEQDLKKDPKTKNIKKGTLKFIELIKEKLPEYLNKNLEYVFNILSAPIGKLINIRTKIGKELFNGIHTLPSAAFRTSKNLERALIALGTKPETAKFMADEYARFNKKYQAILKDGNIKSGNLPINLPLSVLHSNGELPPQLVFAMMVAVFNFIAKHPTSIRFRGTHDQEIFLYGTQVQNLMGNEFKEIRDIGPGYHDTARIMGGEIISILSIYKGESESIYLTKLGPALGLAALQIEHGPSENQEQVDEKDQNELENNETPRFRIESHTWNFDPDYQEKRIFNNGLTKEQIQEKVDRGEAEEDRNPNSKNFGKVISIESGRVLAPGISEYKHIKMNLNTDKTSEKRKDGTYTKEIPREFTEESKESVKDLDKVLKTDLDTEFSLVLTSPAKNVVTSIRNSLGKIPEYTRNVLRQMQDVVWTASDTVPIAAALDRAGFRDSLHGIAGTEPMPEGTHEVRLESIEASNEDKIRALDDLLRAYDNGGENNILKKFYYKYHLQTHHRILMDGAINPQQSHVTRYFVRPFDAVDYNSENLWLFKLSVVGSLGFKIDKNDLDAAIAEFDRITTDPNVSVNVLAAVDAITKIDEKGQAERLAKLLPLIQFSLGGDTSILNGLVALSKYMPVNGKPVKSFSSDVILEIDGISNGFAMNLMQFPIFEDLETKYNQTGTSFGNTEEKTTHNPYNADVYQELVQLVIKYSTPEFAQSYTDDPDNRISKKDKNSFNLNNYAKQNTALNELYPNLMSGDRDLVKYPFLIFMYGGGVKSISEGVAKTILSDLYVQLDAIQQEYNNMPALIGESAAIGLASKQQYLKRHVKPFINNLVRVKAFDKKRGKELLTAIENNESQTIRLTDSKMITNVGKLLRPRFDQGLTDMLGGTGEARQAVISAGEVIHAVFLAHYNKAKNAAEIITPAKIDKSGKVITKEVRRPPLTEEEIDKLVKSELLHVFPQYRGPLFEVFKDDEFIDLSKRLTFEDLNDANKIQFQFKNSKGGNSSAQSSPRDSEFVSAGVSTLIRMIINMDASILTKVLSKHPRLLALHDAFMGNPVQLLEASKDYGIEYIELNSKHSVITSIAKRMNHVIALTKKADKDNNSTELMDEVNKWIAEKAHGNKYTYKPSDIQSLSQIIEVVNTANTNVKEKRAAVQTMQSKRGGWVSQQLYMAQRLVRTGLDEVSSRFYLTRPLEVAQIAEDRQKERDNIKKEFKEAIQKEKENGRFLSLDNLRRDNPITTLAEDLTENNIMDFFNQFKEFSRNYYSSEEEMNKHTLVLEKVLRTLAKGMDEVSSIHLNIEDIDGIAQGEFDAEVDELRVSLSRQAPLSVNAQTPQEVYVHETVHAMIAIVLANKPILKRQINQVFNLVKADLAANEGYKVFLRSVPGGVKNASKADEEAAKDFYKYIFKNIDNDAYKLDEFLAYALTNRDLVSYLSDPKSKINRQRSRLPEHNTEGMYGRVIDKLLHLIDVIADALIKTFTRTHGRTAHAEMLAILESLINIQNKHKTKYQLLREQGYKLVERSDQFLIAFGQKHYEKLLESDVSLRLQKSAKNIDKALSENSHKLKNYQIVYEVMHETLGSMVHEVMDGVLGKQLIEQLLIVKVSISKARALALNFYLNWFNGNADAKLPGIWKSIKGKDIPVPTKIALTTVLLKTDLSSLLLGGPLGKEHGFTHQEIVDLLGDTRNIIKQLNNIKRKLKKLTFKKTKSARHLFLYAGELGDYIVSGDTHAHIPSMNAFDIAQSMIVDVTPTDVALVDAYATLTALQNGNITGDIQAVKSLINNEFAEDNISNGIIDLLDSHREYKERSLTFLFKDNPIHMVKGYIVKRVEDLTSIKTGLDSQVDEMKKEGYPEVYPLNEIPGIERTHNTLFVGRNVPPIPYKSAIMSISNQRNMGTTLTQILSEDVNYQKAPFKNGVGIPDILKIKKAIRKVTASQVKEANKPIAQLEKDYQTRKINKNKKLRLRPVVDDIGQITDHRILMNHKTEREILNPELEIQNVFAHMNSLYVDRKNTIKADKRTVDILVYEQTERMPSYPNEFIDFLDPAEGYVDRFYRLPQEVREYILKFAVNGVFKVRKDIVNKTFGYAAWDLSAASVLQQPSMIRAKRYVALLHYLLREIVGWGKDRIVIAMPQVVVWNALSNVLQLTMRKIPIEYTQHKIVEGFIEYQRYREDNDALRELKHRIKSKSIAAPSKEHKEEIRLEASINNNRIKRMSDVGMNALILEDMNNVSMDGFMNRVYRMAKSGKYAKHANKIPTQLTELAALLALWKSTAPYQFARHIVQMTDFLGRYVMIEHAMEVKGQSFEVAMHESIDGFVLFDEALTPALEFIDAIGLTWFISYFLRNNRSSRQIAKANPTSVGLSAAFQYTTGIPTLGNVDGSFLTGDVVPDTFKLDELFEEATDLTGLDLLKDFLIDPVTSIFTGDS